eukprot:gnl/MRDRNA2_/MRDRNA2_20188_c0_seq1.p1 gnl/MRDRNA2_/MRDRNA2_20188_c0~~gnl/MRDRNA2_/MRDRNA2_20188_c0_seq1.p1  ORF type:complete len:378 (-),score=79.13 gnl/MRDRNA2_/MRDRNA2_20188_c0_seq1:196-1329(-)
MLIGVICEVASEVSVKEREMRAAKSLKQDFMEFLVCFDLDQDNKIGIQEFELLLSNPDVKRMLDRHEIDGVVLSSLKNHLFIDKQGMAAARDHVWMKCMDTGMDPQEAIEGLPLLFKTLTFNEFIDIVLRFKGGSGNQATVLDVISTEDHLSSQLEHLASSTMEGYSTQCQRSGTRRLGIDEQQSFGTSDMAGETQANKLVFGTKGSPVFTKSFTKRASPNQSPVLTSKCPVMVAPSQGNCPEISSSEEAAHLKDQVSGFEVRLNGLQVAKDFNGKIALLQLQQNEAGLVLVKLKDTGKELLVPPQNLQTVVAASACNYSGDQYAPNKAQGLESRIEARMEVMEARMKALTDTILQHLPMHANANGASSTDAYQELS